MNKEKWIEEVLQTAKTVKPVSSNPFMTTRIETKLQEAPVINRMPLKWAFASAAIMLLILIINITIWHGSVQIKQNSGLQQLVHEYGWSNNDFYSMNYSK